MYYVYYMLHEIYKLVRRMLKKFHWSSEIYRMSQEGKNSLYGFQVFSEDPISFPQLQRNLRPKASRTTNWLIKTPLIRQEQKKYVSNEAKDTNKNFFLRQQWN